MKQRILINDISFTRFVKELIERVKEFPTYNLGDCNVGDNSKVENAFMFSAVLEGEQDER